MSNLTFKADITDYDSALAFLDGRKRRKLAHNTDVVLEDERAHVTYHGNVIATFLRQEVGSFSAYMLELPPVVVLDTAGWSTVTTTLRLNAILGWVTDKYRDPALSHNVGITKGEAVWRSYWSSLAPFDSKPIERSIEGVSLAVFSGGHVRTVARGRYHFA